MKMTYQPFSKHYGSIMNQKHKEETINKVTTALSDVGTALIARIKPMLDLVYEVGYNQGKQEANSGYNQLIKDVDELKSTLPITEKYWNPRTFKPIDINKGCPVCGIGADGKPYGYVCTRNDCPTRVTC